MGGGATHLTGGGHRFSVQVRILLQGSPFKHVRNAMANGNAQSSGFWPCNKSTHPITKVGLGAGGGPIMLYTFKDSTSFFNASLLSSPSPMISATPMN